MKPLYFIRLLFLLGFYFISGISYAQCPGTAVTATLKWDNRWWLITTGNYAYNAAKGVGVTTAMSQSQNFTLGTNRVNIATAIAALGDNTTIQSTAQAGSFGSGTAVEFNGNGTMTFTFDTVVANLNFSLYAIDKSQTANVTATDGSGNPLDITMAADALGTLFVAGSGTTSATAMASAATVAFTSPRSTVNVTIGGFTPAGTNGVKTVTITIGGTAGTWWLSDLSACVYRSFPTNYYTVAKPFTGQPAYILNTSNAATASTTDVNTGNCRWVMTDNTATNKWLNSFGYDPYEHFLYYVKDGMGVTTNRAIKKYDFNTLSGLNATMSSGTISTLIADVRAAPFNIPTFDIAVESGAASFYNGSLYIGIEGTNNNSTATSGRYSMAWRIDFDASFNPIKAAQVYAVKADNGTGTLLHDWGDFSISNGVMYDFNSAGSGSWIHYDLQTGLIVSTYPANSNPVPGESGVAWNENVYWLGGLVDSIALYNKNGTIGPESHLAGKAAIDWTTSGSGDGSDAFKPPLDYGDAPASYDPAGSDPATHDFDSTLKLGTYWNAEFAKKTSANATGDGATDDGIPILPTFTNYQTTYGANVNVYNHTGANATLIGWIDLNNDGLFDASEGSTPVTVSSSTSMQSIALSWTGAASIPLSATNVFMRIRLTSASNGMTVNNALGYYSNGEVEDYMIPVSVVLATRLVSFTGVPLNGHDVRLNWATANEMNMQSYTIERSSDGTTWGSLRTLTPNNRPESTQQYSTDDLDPQNGDSYYRLRMTDYGGSAYYSEVVKVNLDNVSFTLTVAPNPFKGSLVANVALGKEETLFIRLIDTRGNLLYSQSVNGKQGTNLINLNHLPELPQGLYILEVLSPSGTAREKIVRD
ncbi:GEVED domain-containing protein [Puia dinghuensis]|uniref:GEVED domain-containing protein n=1 Tax=Puia dinghuensis TaxID=1792502 RepID=A0A8J2UE79_9BACT|nr:GEVED domain-containing protein [Puia dinghuensis]GGB04224.1 hypothetical protein GCM10011511_29420 [Puia dinghuensis]